MKITQTEYLKRAKVIFRDGEEEQVREWLDSEGFMPVDRKPTLKIELHEGKCGVSDPLQFASGHTTITVEKRISDG